MVSEQAAGSVLRGSVVQCDLQCDNLNGLCPPLILCALAWLVRSPLAPGGRIAHEAARAHNVSKPCSYPAEVARLLVVISIAMALLACTLAHPDGDSTVALGDPLHFVAQRLDANRSDSISIAEIVVRFCTVRFLPSPWLVCRPRVCLASPRFVACQGVVVLPACGAFYLASLVVSVLLGPARARAPVGTAAGPTAGLADGVSDGAGAEVVAGPAEGAVAVSGNESPLALEPLDAPVAGEAEEAVEEARVDPVVALDEPMQEYLAAEFHGGGGGVSGALRLGVARSLSRSFDGPALEPLSCDSRSSGTFASRPTTPLASFDSIPASVPGGFLVSEPLGRLASDDKEPADLAGDVWEAPARRRSTAESALGLAEMLAAIGSGEQGTESAGGVLGAPGQGSARFADLAGRFADWDLNMFDVFEASPNPLVSVGFVTLDAFSHAVDIDRPKMVRVPV